MGTKFAAYTLKLTCLHEYYQRLLHGTLPIPSGFDMANTIKYFSQTLLCLLKEVRESPLEMIQSQSLDNERMAMYPSLDYRQLYNALTQLMDVVPLVHIGLHAFGQAILQCLACLLPFLDNDLIDNVPYLTASAVSVLPVELHQEIINYLCFYILPFTIKRKTEDGSENYASQSVSAVIMMVFQYSNNPAHQCQLLECVMALKQGIIKDILCVMAYGTVSARISAAKLLFYYWPTFNQNLFDRRAVLMKFADDLTPFVCQRDSCPNAGNVEAGKVCYDHRTSITFANDSPPPLYLCIECANEIHREHSNLMFHDVLHRMQQVSMICENKNCRANDKSAISVCFATECASYNGNHPIRYCLQCHNIRHNNRRGNDHIYHTALPQISRMDRQTQTYMVQAIISLLKEAEPTMIDSNRDSSEVNNSKTNVAGFSGISGNIRIHRLGLCDQTSLEDRQLLGRYGVWLLVGLCTPLKDTPADILGRMLSMLFHWFHATAYSFDGQTECTLEKLKTEYVCSWLFEVMKTHYQVFVSCLLPHPADYVRIGGHWETLASRTSHLKDGLNRLFCLVPYEVITSEIWDYVMPHWMEAMVHDVPERELLELKIILCKMLDPDMSPLGFDTKKMYNFMAQRFINASAIVQEQALNWLQTLTMLEIMIPLSLLFSMFKDGIEAMQSTNTTNFSNENMMKKVPCDKGYLTNTVVENDSEKSTPLSDDVVPTPRHIAFSTNAELNLSCCVLMLDVLLKQMELQDVDRHAGIYSWVCRESCYLMKLVMATSWSSKHGCNVNSECTYCESKIVWHQLCLQLLTYMAPSHLAHPPDVIIDDVSEDYGRRNSLEITKKCDSKPDVVINMPIPELHSVGGVLVHMPHFFEQIMTATVETVSEQLDLSAIIPAERVISAMARAVTLSETNVDTVITNVATPQLDNEDAHSLSEQAKDVDDFWQTTVGKFKFTIEELPEQLQYIHKLLKEIIDVENSDIIYYMLQCLSVMCLYGDALTLAAKDHQGFFIWCQENLLIKNLWDLLSAEYSHIAQVSVPLLLHCITLPHGADTFWRLIQDEFHNSDWRIRFIAVERVTLMARFMDSSPLRNVVNLQAALASVFCYLITSMDDANVYVAQRATLNIGTIHDTAIRSLLFCLETQFDSVIVDRPMILQSVYQLHNSLSDRRILTWEFFLNRFDALFLEAQISLERSGDLTYIRDLRNTDLNSEIFVRKLQRAHEALSQYDGSGTNSLKTLSASFGTKWPYKRTMSAPASILHRQDTKQEKEKVYNRQYSAPTLKRKSSRFGLDGHVHSLHMVDEGGNLPAFIHKIVNLEEADKETLHLLVFLLIQFLSRTDQAYPTDEKPLSKTQGIVLRHLYLLLGYNQTDRIFHTPPQRLRHSSVFNVFLTNLPQVLDQNNIMGWVMIPPVLAILRHCPCPPQGIPSTEYQPPIYSLWYLEPHIRRSWLMSLLIILYKFQYGQQVWYYQLQALIRIVINTLNRQHHQCKRIPAMVVMGGPPSRSRDLSQPSLGTDHDLLATALEEVENESSTLGGMRITNQQQSLRTDYNYIHGIDSHFEESDSVLHSSNKNSSCSFNADDTESELAAIPESTKSDSTLYDSSCGSLGEVEENITNFRGKTSAFRYHVTANTKKGINNLNSNISKHQELAENASGHMSREHNIQKGRLFATEKRSNFIEELKILSTNTSLAMQSEFPKSVLNVNLMKCAEAQAVKNGNTECSKSRERIGTAHEVYQHQRNCESTCTLNWEPLKYADEMVSINSSAADAKNINTAKSTHLTTVSSVFAHITGSKTEHELEDIRTKFIVPKVERLLPVGVGLHDGGTFFEHNNDTSKHGIESSSSITQLEFPMQERLLPIGLRKGSVAGIVKSVHQVLNLSEPKDNSSTSQNIINIETDEREIKPILKDDQSPPKLNDKQFCICNSQRKLTKQVALESPPPIFEPDFIYHLRDCERKSRAKDNVRIQQNKIRKSSVSTTNRTIVSTNRQESWSGPKMQPKLDDLSQQACHADFNLKQSLFRIGDDCVYERCCECGLIKEEYSDEELGLCIIVLGTFIHREPSLAAPFLPEILTAVTKVALKAMYSWQSETNMHLPGGAVSVAHQFLRCVLHQLAPNAIFMQMFQTRINVSTRMQFFKSVAQALTDFNELNPIAPLQLLLETLNTKKSLPLGKLSTILHNIACYLDCLPLEAGLGPGAITWSGLLSQFEGFFRKLVLLLSSIEDITPALRIMTSILKVPGIQQSKGLLDPFSKVLSYSIQNCTLKYNFLTDLCHLCHRGFTRERDKHFLGRTIVFELVQAIKFKTTLPDTNFLLLLHFVLQDVGGTLPTTVSSKEISTEISSIFNSNASESLKNQISDVLDFLADFHTLSKVKSFNKGLQSGLNEDTLGGLLKCGLAQYLALEITRGNNRENRAVSRFLPWLYNAPSMIQLGVREYADCISHIRLLTWLLLGSLIHSVTYSVNCNFQTHGNTVSCAQPIPLEGSCYIADHIQVIFSGYPEQSRTSVQHTSALSQAFILCQLWTVYLEEMVKNNSSNNEHSNSAINILLDFWSKITPCILHLMSHSKQLAELVNLHFLNLLDIFLDRESILLNKLLPMWIPIILCHQHQFPGHLHVRLKSCDNDLPQSTMDYFTSSRQEGNRKLLRWLKRIQFKMGQIEMQYSNVTQFYSI